MPHVSSVLLSESHFTSCCSGSNGLVLASGDGVSVGLFTFLNCDFKDCCCDAPSSDEARFLYFKDGSYDRVEFIGNHLLNCSGGAGQGSVLSVTPFELVFLNNTLDLLVTGCQSAAAFGLHDERDSLVIENSSFSNGNTRMTLGNSHFVYISNDHQDVCFDNCTFRDIEAAGCPSFEITVGTLRVTDCEFSHLTCEWNGGGLHTSNTRNVYVHNSTFCSCRAGSRDLGGGGLYIEIGCQ